MANRSLPFHDNFFDLFEKQIIEKWEAKEFINKILLNKLTIKQRQKVYQGINVLVDCKYLNKSKNPRKAGTYLYSESDKIKSYRHRKNHEKLISVLNEKRNYIQKGITLKKIEVNFINELKNEHPNLAKQMDLVGQTQHSELHELTVQEKMVEKLLDYFTTEAVYQSPN